MISCVMVSDIQVTVTYPDGNERYFDGLQKVYPLANNMAVGFAGNIKLSLEIVSVFQRILGLPNQHLTVFPRKAIYKCYRKLRRLYSILCPSPKNEQQVDLLVLGVSPLSPILAPTWGWTLRSPHFEPKPIPYCVAESIGSGNQCNEFMAILKKSNDDFKANFNSQQSRAAFFNHGPIQWEIRTPGKMAQMRAASIVLDVDKAKASKPGVSIYYQIATVTRQQVTIVQFDRTHYQEGREPEKFITPPLVSDWDSLVKVAESHGILLKADVVAVG